MTPEEIRLRLEKVQRVQSLIKLLIDKGNIYNKWVNDELLSIKAEISRLREVATFQHSPEPVKRLSVEDLERLMQKP